MHLPIEDAHTEVRGSHRRSRKFVLQGGNHKLLMIGHAAPPQDSAEVERSAKFVNGLRYFGWLPTVWTSNEVDSLPLDPTLCDRQPPGAAVCPRNTGSGILAMRRSLRGFVNARAGEGLTAVASRFAKAGELRLEAWQSATSLPDDYIPWARRTINLLMRQIRSEHFNAIYSTSSAASNHWLALELKRRTNLPWVADFRDLWNDDCRYRDPSPQRLAAHPQLEQEILESADVVIAVSERQRRILADQIPTKYDSIIAIKNGSVSAEDAGAGDAKSEGATQFNGCGSQDSEPDCCSELARQLAVVLDRLADQVAKADEVVHESLTTCPP